MSGWRYILGATREYRVNGRLLAVSISMVGSGWKCIAIEVAEDASDDQVLSDHGHKLIGTRKTEGAARRACERYAEAWVKQRIELARCECTEIPPPPITERCPELHQEQSA